MARGATEAISPQLSRVNSANVRKRLDFAPAPGCIRNDAEMAIMPNPTNLIRFIPAEEELHLT
jgi:hypothetical protein